MNKYDGSVSTNMSSLMRKTEGLSFCFAKNVEKMNNDTTLKEILNNNYTIQANKEKVFGQLPLEHFIGFCNTFKKVTSKLGSHLTLKTIDLQDYVYTTLPPATIINVSFDNMPVIVPNFIPSLDTQVFYNKSIKNSFTLSFDL